MANWKVRERDRTWQDWSGILLGIVIALAPWIVEETKSEPVIVNAAIAGFAAMMLAELDLVSLRRWAEAGQLVCGLWVAASPLIFSYGDTGMLRFWHLVAGLLVALLGLIELRRYAGRR